MPAINLLVAGRLRDYADVLMQQGEGGFRAKAFRRAADVVATLDRPVDQILSQEGREGLIALPAVGTGIANAIAEMVGTGRWSQLDRLRGELAPEVLFRSIPGIGAKLAGRLAAEGQIESLEELEHAVRFGKLHVKGLGPRRMRMIAAAIVERFGGPTLPRRIIAARPSVSQLLQVDRIYRERTAAGQLRKIAPKRFNPAGDAWLPILHARHGDWHFTAMFSNSQLAHRLHKTSDWVVIYYHKDGEPEGRCTVVTVSSGPWLGQRIVRGRETAEDEEEISK
ncbi:helix-hairpin-helix domain-containing protein [Mesorhizobium dulcispinae]|uniref:helix-hairpin-helix domain-containing protein n=1 Tax=Mesorhizobium dulcispinae TaxID=3072316 RepID=UPI002A2447FB|nr:helix-hairpin-helix domain-containing protein [Mesorhizobium sp. VK23D]MDX8519877.1 helix-hairpin-helix domain-containing protein [Mesorhizobium sp. VK23D]